ncbi:hypothetical protein A0H76_2750 [Hepatospora eriocheir]|uniref:C2 tensin-type domain-containing protein n=1 Tax=Hepatospora eriocheir TaxID=1081669 RepID=A0A1X0QET8_9MICR|nr:hypothetical protein A0H76_2750 [Hepatospora eriocheir]
MQNKPMLLFLSIFLFKLEISNSVKDAFLYYILENLNFKRFLNKSCISAVKRYCEYHKKHYSQKESCLLLRQIIITTIPKFVSHIKPFPILEVTTNNGTTVIPCDMTYFDSYHMLISPKNLSLDTDIVLSLFLDAGIIIYKILSISLNTTFYSRGIYRFNRNEIETSYSDHDLIQNFDDEFSIDLVFIDKTQVNENFNSLVKRNTQKNNVINQIKSIKETKKFDTSDWNNYTLPKFELTPKISNKKQSYTSSIKPIKSIPSIVKTPTNNKTSEIIKKIEECDQYTNIFYVKQIANPKINNQETSNKNRKRKVSIKKAIPHKLNVIIDNPLHLTPIKNIEGTIFEDMSNYNISINIPKFEELFCVDVSTKTVIKKETNIKSFDMLISSKRLFLVSLAVKYLESKI